MKAIVDQPLFKEDTVFSYCIGREYDDGSGRVNIVFWGEQVRHGTPEQAEQVRKNSELIHGAPQYIFRLIQQPNS